MSYQRRFGLSAVSAGYVDCGKGLSVLQGTPCPAPLPPINPNDPAIVQAQADYNARAARCKAYRSKEYAIAGGAGVAALLFLPGAWKFLALPIAVIVDIQYPRSPDCDYGF